MSAAMTMRRKWFAPEVVQTSAMDCGPAALKCLLEGFGIRASYGRLREACQTGIDGTSIDTIEAVANRLGIAAEQVMLPPDQLFQGSNATLPALAVVQLPSGPAHFILVWRQAGHWLQVMDPAAGRRWVRREEFLKELFRHELSVPAADWRDWAAGDEYRDAVTQRLAALGVGQRAAAGFLATALADDNWYSAAVL
ncbi:MAG: ABC transporter permease, partial [Aestuariivirga sp.]|nr:ABC transporter permease [Aestuariivirga sp.]